MIFSDEVASVVDAWELCWSVPGGEEISVGKLQAHDACPLPADTWPMEVTLALPPGMSAAKGFLAAECSAQASCVRCAQPGGIVEVADVHHVATARNLEFFACTPRAEVPECSVPGCQSFVQATPEVQAGDGMSIFTQTGTHTCSNAVWSVTFVAFGCEPGALLSLTAAIMAVLWLTALAGIFLQAWVRRSSRTAMVGRIELTLTGRDGPSEAALLTCLQQGLGLARPPGIRTWRTEALDGATVVSLQYSYSAQDDQPRVTQWATEMTSSCCRVDTGPVQVVKQPGRLLGADILRCLIEAAKYRHSADSAADEMEELRLDMAHQLLQGLRSRRVQTWLVGNYLSNVAVAFCLPMLAGLSDDICGQGYPLWSHILWALHIAACAVFQWLVLRQCCSDQALTERFCRKFIVHLSAAWCIGAISQTDIYMDITFPVIARACGFDLWKVSAWICAMGIGIGQVLQVLFILWKGARRSRNAMSVEARERAELTDLFLLLRATDATALCFIVRPALEQQLGGASSWILKIVEARVPATRFLLEDVEQAALQLIFLLYFDTAAQRDSVWLCIA